MTAELGHKSKKSPIEMPDELEILRGHGVQSD